MIKYHTPFYALLLIIFLVLMSEREVLNGGSGYVPLPDVPSRLMVCGLLDGRDVQSGAEHQSGISYSLSKIRALIPTCYGLRFVTVGGYKDNHQNIEVIDVVDVQALSPEVRLLPLEDAFEPPDYLIRQLRINNFSENSTLWVECRQPRVVASDAPLSMIVATGNQTCNYTMSSAPMDLDNDSSKKARFGAPEVASGTFVALVLPLKGVTEGVVSDDIRAHQPSVYFQLEAKVDGEINSVAVPIKESPTKPGAYKRTIKPRVNIKLFPSVSKPNWAFKIDVRMIKDGDDKRAEHEKLWALGTWKIDDKITNFDKVFWPEVRMEFPKWSEDEKYSIAVIDEIKRHVPFEEVWKFAEKSGVSQFWVSKCEASVLQCSVAILKEKIDGFLSKVSWIARDNPGFCSIVLPTGADDQARHGFIPNIESILEKVAPGNHFILVQDSDVKAVLDEVIAVLNKVKPPANKKMPLPFAARPIARNQNFTMSSVMRVHWKTTAEFQLAKKLITAHPVMWGSKGDESALTLWDEKVQTLACLAKALSFLVRRWRRCARNTTRGKWKKPRRRSWRQGRRPLPRRRSPSLISDLVELLVLEGLVFAEKFCICKKVAPRNRQRGKRIPDVPANGMRRNTLSGLIGAVGCRKTSWLLLLCVFLTLVPGAAAMDGNASGGRAETVITIIAVNIASAMLNKVEKLRDYVHKYNPDFLVVSENGLKKVKLERKKTWMEGMIPSYRAYHIPDAEEDSLIPGGKGISAFVHETWAPFVESVAMDQKLRLVHIKIRHPRKKVHIVGIYAPASNKQKVEYWREMNAWYGRQAMQEDDVVLIGDMNVTPDRRVDSTNTEKRHLPGSGVNSFDVFIEGKGLQDVWRKLHPEEKGFTWIQMGSKNALETRIDLALCTKSVVQNVRLCKIATMEPTIFRDHAPLVLKMGMKHAYRSGEKIQTFEMPEINIKNWSSAAFRDQEKVDEYKTRMSEAIREITNEKDIDERERYERLTSRMMEIGEIAFEPKQRTVGGDKQHTYADSDSIMLRQCLKVLRSRRVWSIGVLNGLQMPITKAMSKIAANAPVSEGISVLPIVENSEWEEWDAWFQKVKDLYRKLRRRVDEREKERISKRIEKFIARADESEIARQKMFYKGSDPYKQTNKTKQTTVKREVGATPEDEWRIIDEPEQVKGAIWSFWGSLFKKLERHESEDDAPWLDGRFSEERRDRIGNNKGKMMTNVQVEELVKTIKGQKNGKSAGPDNVPIELYKALPHEGYTLLAQCFSAFVEKKKIPESWRKSKIFTIFKGGDPTKCSNYRPITLTNVGYKIFMGVITARLTEFVEKYKLLSNSQGGFRKGRGCTDKVNLLIKARMKHISEEKESHVFFVDITKAYDSVDHETLWKHLEAHCLPEDFLELLREVYRDGKASVITVFGETRNIDLERGLKQGGPDSPIIFDLFLEPLLWYLNKGKDEKAYVLAFADDIANITTTLAQAQKSFDKLQKFFFRSYLEMGISGDKKKTAYTRSNAGSGVTYRVIQKSLTEGNIRLRMTDQIKELPRLEADESYRYLGVWWNMNLGWATHISKLETRLNIHLQYLWSAHYTKRQCITIINKVIVPYLTYAAECILIPEKKLSDWDEKISRLVNKKANLPRHAMSLPNYLPEEDLGEGVKSIADTYEERKIAEQMRHGLNSDDIETATLSEERWKADPENDPKKAVIRERRKMFPGPVITRNRISELEKGHINAVVPAELSLGETLRRLRITQFEQIVDDNGNFREVREIWAGIPGEYKMDMTEIEGERMLNHVRRLICVGRSSHVYPLILARWEHRTALQGIEQQGEKIELWTDGSKSADSECIGIFFGEENKKNTSFKFRGVGRSIFEIEAMAICDAISMHDPRKDLVIYSDNEGAVNTVSQPEGRRQLKVKHPIARERVALAERVLQLRELSGKTTIVKHVFSHLLDDGNDMPAMEKIRKRSIMAKKFGNNTGRILQGNAEADRLATKARDTFPRLWRDESREDAPFCARDVNGILIVDLKDFLRDRQRRRMNATLRNERYQSHHEWRNNENIDRKASGSVMRVRSRKLSNLQNYISRARRTLIPCNGEAAFRADNEWLVQYKYGGVAVEEPFCLLCGEYEDKFHFTECEKLKQHRTNIRKRVNESMEKIAGRKIPVLSNFWGTKREREEENTEDNGVVKCKKLESFPTELAARGVLPAGLSPLLTRLLGNDSEVISQATLEIQTAVTQGFHSAYKDKCKRWNERYRKPPDERRDKRRKHYKNNTNPNV